MSLFELNWALNEKCASPLHKLALIGIAESRGDQPAVNVDRLAGFCGVDRADLEVVLRELRAAGQIEQLAYSNCGVWAIAYLGAPEDERWERESIAPALTRKERTFWLDRLTGEGEGLCWYCGHLPSETHIEHQIPRSRGGQNTEDNLVLACKSCNHKKRSRTVEEYRAVMARSTLEDDFLFYGERAA